MYFNFTNPNYLILLFIIPILIFFHFYSIKNIRGKSIAFANFEAIARVKGIDLYSKNIIILLLNIAMVSFLIFSLSGLTLYKEMEISSFSFVIAIDSSESMGAVDIYPDRLSASKETSIEFINSLPKGSRVGVISFSGNSFIEHEISDKKEEVANSIRNIELKKFGGTDIYEAISISSFMLEDEENKAVILISDGQLNVGSVYDSVEYAKKNNILIHTFGIGTAEGGETSFGISRIDEDSLKSLAYSTGSKYFKVTSAEEMRKSFDEIMPLTKKFIGINLSLYLIIITIAIFMIQQFLIEVLRINI